MVINNFLHVIFMKRRSKEKFKSITKNIMVFLGVGAGVSLLAILGGGKNGSKLLKSLAKFSKWQIIQTLKDLRLRGYITFDEDDEKSPIVITDAGMKRVLHHRLSDMFNLYPKKWDYLWRMVTFDIPEKRKAARETFRRELNRVGFYQLQKSVFVTPFKCEKDIIELCKLNGILKYVLVVTVASLGPRETSIRNYFFQKK